MGKEVLLLNKAIAEGAVAVAYTDQVVFEVQVVNGLDGSAVICMRGEMAVEMLDCPSLFRAALCLSTERITLPTIAGTLHSTTDMGALSYACALGIKATDFFIWVERIHCEAQLFVALSFVLARHMPDTQKFPSRHRASGSFHHKTSG